MEYKIINVRDCPGLADRAADYFSSKWPVPRETYCESISDSLTTAKPLPRWYLMMKNDEIIGSFGLIQNDFIDRTDLFPWICAVYIEESERGKALGSKLLERAVIEAALLGFEHVYLVTDHVGYYEKYGFDFIGMGNCDDGSKGRIYHSNTTA